MRRFRVEHISHTHTTPTLSHHRNLTQTVSISSCFSLARFRGFFEIHTPKFLQFLSPFSSQSFPLHSILTFQLDSTDLLQVCKELKQEGGKMKTDKSFVLLHNDTDHVFINHSDDDEQVQTNDRQTDSTNMAKKRVPPLPTPVHNMGQRHTQPNEYT